MLIALNRNWSLGLEINDEQPPEDAWIRARTLILGSQDFSDEERALLVTSSLGTVTQDLRNLEAKHAKESHIRRFTSKTRLRPILDGLVNLDSAISSIANADAHGIAPLVWGGVSIVCKVNMALLSWLVSHLDQLFPLSTSRSPSHKLFSTYF